MDDREIDLKQDVIEQIKLEKLLSVPDYPIIDLSWAKHDISLFPGLL